MLAPCVREHGADNARARDNVRGEGMDSVSRYSRYLAAARALCAGGAGGPMVMTILSRTVVPVVFKPLLVAPLSAARALGLQHRVEVQVALPTPRRPHSMLTYILCLYGGDQHLALAQTLEASLTNPSCSHEPILL